jgi:hypothetical protein
MEVKETAACGISQREFAVELDRDEFGEMYKLLRYVQDGSGVFDEDFVEDLQSQMSYIIGPSLEEDPPEDIAEEKMEWEDTGVTLNLNFNDEMARKLRQIVSAVESPGEGFEAALLQKVMDGMKAIDPTIDGTGY